MVALATVVLSPVVVSWYVPSVMDMPALRGQKAHLKASIVDLEQRGGKQQISHCGPERRLCGDDYAGIYGKDADYRIAKSYRVSASPHIFSNVAHIINQPYSGLAFT